MSPLCKPKIPLPINQMSSQIPLSMLTNNTIQYNTIQYNITLLYLSRNSIVAYVALKTPTHRHADFKQTVTLTYGALGGVELPPLHRHEGKHLRSLNVAQVCSRYGQRASTSAMTTAACIIHHALSWGAGTDKPVSSLSARTQIHTGSLRLKRRSHEGWYRKTLLRWIAR